jgi:glyoxylase-like metal-dependent hydrolase (beta-lactamase superfamily II)
VRELEPGVWHWQTPHPEWSEGEPWGPEVSSYAIDGGGRLLLFDPLGVPDGLLELAADREPAIVLTAPWHERDAQSLVERLGAPIHTPPADTAEDLIQKFGITAEQAGDGSPDLAWLRAAGSVEANYYGGGDRLPIGVEAFEGREQNDLVLWVESRRAVVAGDTLVDFGRGFQVADWLRADLTREQVVQRLRPLLKLPVELVLPAHGAPTDRAALERALA